MRTGLSCLSVTTTSPPQLLHRVRRRCAAALLLVAALGCAHCSSSKAIVERPAEQYIHMAPTSPSRLHVPLHITRGALVEVINAQLPQVVLADPDFGGYGLQLDVQRAGRLELAFRQNPTDRAEVPRLHYEVPLRIQVKKNALITTLRADGDLKLKFSTVIGLKSDWTVIAKTELLGFDWTRAPALGVGGLSIPIEGLTSKLIQRTKTDITKGIDKGIEENVSLKDALLAAVNGIATPQILSEDYGGYFMAKPTALGMAPLAEYQGGIATVLQIDLIPQLGLGRPPAANLLTSVPPNTGVQDLNDRFELSIHSLLGYEDMQELLGRSLIDTTLSQSGRSATIKEVEVYGQGERIVIGLRMIGDYNGWAYLKARPVFDADSKRMELRDVDVQLDTRNLLYKVIGGLFRGRIIRALDEQIGDQVSAQLEAARLGIEQQLQGTEVIPGIKIHGAADRVRVTEALVTPAGVSAEILFTGSLGVTIEHIPVE